MDQVECGARDDGERRTKSVTKKEKEEEKDKRRTMSKH